MTYPVFATGDVLPASDMNAIGMWLIKTQTVTTGTEILLDDVFSASYDQYQIVYRFTAASASQNIQYQNRVSATNAATNYEAMHAGYRPTNATATVASSVVGTTFMFVGGSTTTVFASGSITAYSPQKATDTIFTGSAFGADGTSSYGINFGGRHTTATAYTGFRMYPSTGTFSGTVRVYGIRN